MLVSKDWFINISKDGNGYLLTKRRYSRILDQINWSSSFSRNFKTYKRQRYNIVAITNTMTFLKRPPLRYCATIPKREMKKIRKNKEES